MTLSALEQVLEEIKTQEVQQQQESTPPEPIIQEEPAEEPEESIDPEPEGDVTPEDEAVDISDSGEDKRQAEGRNSYKNREKIRQIESEKQQLAERLANLEGRMQQQQQQTQQPQGQVAPEEIEPDRELYPDEHTEYELRKLKNQVGNLMEHITRQHHETQGVRAREEFRAIEQDFSRTVKDYESAKNFLKKQRTTELSIIYPSASASDINDQIALEEIQTASLFAQQKRNPAEVLYEYAKVTGYNPQTQSSEKYDNKPTTNLAAIRRNKAKSSGFGSSSSRGSQDVTSEQLYQMTIGEQAMIPPSVRDRIYKNQE